MPIASVMQRLREPGLRVECGRNLFLDRCEEPFGGRAVQDRVEQHIGGEQVVSQNASVVAGHIVALRMQHAVHRDEAQELLRLAGNEDQIEGQPVTGESGDEAEPGHDPWVVKQAPGDHLHQADRETEVDSAAADELHRRPTHALHQVVELGLVVHQGGDGEILQIDEPRQVGLHFRKQVVDDSRGGRVHARQHSLTTGFRIESHSPGRTCSARSRAISSMVRVSGSRSSSTACLASILSRISSGRSSLSVSIWIGHRRGLAGAARNHALPTERPDADELDRPVKHLQRNEFRCVADESGNQRHRQIDEPVRA